MACHLMMLHNIHYMMTLMDAMRHAILANNFPSWLISFLKGHYPPGEEASKPCPPWVRDALAVAGIDIRGIYDWQLAEAAFVLQEEERVRCKDRRGSMRHKAAGDTQATQQLQLSSGKGERHRTSVQTQHIEHVHDRLAKVTTEARKENSESFTKWLGVTFILNQVTP
jgi:hypothetical protein